MTVMTVNCYTDAAHEWLKQAELHDIAAREIDDERDEEYLLHREVAETLRKCAIDIFAADIPPRQVAPQEEIKF